MPRLPNFIIIGEQKCGTTTLNCTLQQHRSIFTPLKEVHFFDRHYKRGYTWYKNLFRNVKPNLICGEKTPTYFYIDGCLKRISENIPNVKLIIMLRNPVDRAVSYYRSNKKIYNIPFSKAVNKGKNFIGNFNNTKSYNEFHFLNRGIYFKQLEKCYKLFPNENIFVYVLEKFIKFQETYLDHIQLNLGVNRELKELLHVNVARRPDKTTINEKRQLHKLYKPYNAKLFDILGYEIKEWNKYE